MLAPGELRVQKWRNDHEQPDADFGWYPWGVRQVSTAWQVQRVSAACEDREGNLVVGLKAPVCIGLTQPVNPPKSTQTPA